MTARPSRTTMALLSTDLRDLQRDLPTAGDLS